MIVGVIVVQTQISRSDSTCNILWKSGAGDCYCCSRYTVLLDSDSEEYGDWRERRLDRIAHLLSVRLRVRLTFPEEDSEDSTAYLLCRSRRLLLLCCAVIVILLGSDSFRLRRLRERLCEHSHFSVILCEDSCREESDLWL